MVTVCVAAASHWPSQGPVARPAQRSRARGWRAQALACQCAAAALQVAVVVWAELLGHPSWANEMYASALQFSLRLV